MASTASWKHFASEKIRFVLHIYYMPDAEQRRQYAIAFAEELRQFERPMPVMDEYDALLSGEAMIQ